MKKDDIDKIIENLEKNIKAGADIHAGDGGYSEGTREKYEAFVEMRNYPIPPVQEKIKVNDSSSEKFFKNK
jgi:hypothetical protein